MPDICAQLGKVKMGRGGEEGNHHEDCQIWDGSQKRGQLYLPRAGRAEDLGFECAEFRVTGGGGEPHEADDSSEAVSSEGI